MKGLQKLTALLLTVLLICSVMGGSVLAAEEAEEDTLADAYLYCQEDGMPKYWLDFTGAMADNLVLHAYFRSSDPTFYESWFILDLDTADIEDNIIEIHNIYDQYGFDHSDWFISFTILLSNDMIILDVIRDESTLAGGTEDNILTGIYMFEPRTYFLPLEEGPFTEEELGVLAQQYYFAVTGFFPPEADVEDNGDGTFTIHLYEIVDLDGLTHTATSAWYTVDEMAFGTDDITGDQIYLAG